MDPYRKMLTPAQRAARLVPHIDPGFVNHRRVQLLLGPAGMDVVDRAIGELPALPEWQREVRIDHIYTEAVLVVARDAMPLAAVAVHPSPEPGMLACSTEVLEGSPEVYKAERLRVHWRSPLETTREVFFDLSTKQIRADTTRSWLSQTKPHSFVAVLDEVTPERLVFGPLVLGAPWLYQPPEGANFETMWLHWQFFEHFVEDIDEFSKVQEVPDKIDWSSMKQISEKTFKACLCEILGDEPTKDWGGEHSDHFSPHVHLHGRRLTAAFLLKGPGGGFERMEITHLGKNGDQIVRLAHEPAELLVVQHCHEIGSAVRETLRTFAVQPSRARRYCLLDGRDSYRLLTAYRLVDKALALSG